MFNQYSESESLRRRKLPIAVVIIFLLLCINVIFSYLLWTYEHRIERLLENEKVKTQATLNKEGHTIVDTYSIRRDSPREHTGTEYVTTYSFRVSGRRYTVSTTFTENPTYGGASNKVSNSDTKEESGNQIRSDVKPDVLYWRCKIVQGRSIPDTIDLIYLPSNPDVNRIEDRNLSCEDKYISDNLSARIFRIVAFILLLNASLFFIGFIFYKTIKFFR